MRQNKVIVFCYFFFKNKKKFACIYLNAKSNSTCKAFSIKNISNFKYKNSKSEMPGYELFLIVKNLPRVSNLCNKFFPY